MFQTEDAQKIQCPSRGLADTRGGGAGDAVFLLPLTAPSASESRRLGRASVWHGGLGLPLPRNGDATLVPAHVVVGGPEADAAEADGLLAVLAVVAWQWEGGRERKRIGDTAGYKTKRVLGLHPCSWHRALKTLGTSYATWATRVPRCSQQTSFDHP